MVHVNQRWKMHTVPVWVNVVVTHHIVIMIIIDARSRQKELIVILRPIAVVCHIVFIIWIMQFEYALLLLLVMIALIQGNAKIMVLLNQMHRIVHPLIVVLLLKEHLVMMFQIAVVCHTA